MITRKSKFRRCKKFFADGIYLTYNNEQLYTKMDKYLDKYPKDKKRIFETIKKMQDCFVKDHAQKFGVLK